MSQTLPTNRLWQPPRLRSVATDGEERHATWLELFYDLILVAAVSQLGMGLHHMQSTEGVLRFVVLSVPVWWTWTGTTFYATRFDTGDLLQRLFYLAQIICIAALAVNLHDGLGGGATGFALAYALLRLLLVTQYAIADHFLPEARDLIRRYMAGFGMAGLLWLVSAFVPPPGRFWLWGVALLFDFGAPLSAGRIHLRVPPHMTHVAERYGLLIIVVLGESILAVVNGVGQQEHWHPLAGLCGMLMLTSAFCLWWLYFDFANRISGVDIIENGRVGLYQIWLYSHLPLTISLTALGVATLQLILAPQTAPLDVFTRWLLCGSLSLTLLTLGGLHATSCSVGTRLKWTYWLPYVLTALLVLLAGGLANWPPFGWGLLAAVLCVALVLSQLMLSKRVYNRACTFSA